MACQDVYLILGYLSGIIGLIIIIFILESYLLKTKKILTSITFILFCIVLITLFGESNRQLALNMIYIFLPAVILAIIFSYVYFIIKSSGSSRKKAIGLLIGIIIFVIDHMMDYSKSPLSFGVTEIISPLLSIIGIVIFTTTQLFIK